MAVAARRDTMIRMRSSDSAANASGFPPLTEAVDAARPVRRIDIPVTVIDRPGWLMRFGRMVLLGMLVLPAALFIVLYVNDPIHSFLILIAGVFAVGLIVVLRDRLRERKLSRLRREYEGRSFVDYVEALSEVHYELQHWSLSLLAVEVLNAAVARGEAGWNIRFHRFLDGERNEPFRFRFEPTPLDEADSSFRSLLDDSSEPPREDYEEPGKEAAQSHRRITRSAKGNIWFMLMAAYGLFAALYIVALSIDKPYYHNMIVYLGIGSCVFLLFYNRWHDRGAAGLQDEREFWKRPLPFYRIDWFIAPAALLIRKPAGAGWRASYLPAASSNLVLIELGKNLWGAWPRTLAGGCISKPCLRKRLFAYNELTDRECAALLAVWECPLPPPGLEQIQAWCGRS